MYVTTIKRAALLLVFVCVTSAGLAVSPGFSAVPPSERGGAPRLDRAGDPLPPFALARLGTTRWVHGDNVSAAAFAPDGKTLASAGFDNAVRLWDAANGKELRCLKHRGWARAVVWSPDGKTLFSAADRDGVRVWDARTGESLRRFGPRDGIPYHLVLSADGRLLVIEQQYDIRTGNSVRSGDRIHLWDAIHDRALHVFESSCPAHAALSPDGKILARGDTGKVRRWRTADGKELPSLPCPGADVYAVAFSADGKTLVSGDGYPGGVVRFWDLAASKERRRLSARQHSGVSALAFSADGKTLACAHGGVDPLLRLLDAESGEVRRQLPLFHGRSDSLHFSPDGKRLTVSACSGRAVTVWDAQTGKEITPCVRHHGVVAAAALSPDGRLAATGGSDPVIRLWQTDAGRFVRELKGHRGEVATLAFAPDGALLASGGSDLSVHLWNVRTGEEQRALPGHRLGVTALAFSPDGRFLASAEGVESVMVSGARHRDGAVRLWDVRSGRQLRSLEAKEGRVHTLAFSPDGAFLATAGWDDKAVHLWDPLTGREVRRLQSVSDPASARGLFEGVAALAFAPDGQTLAAISFYECKSNIHFGDEKGDGQGRMLRLWEVSTGKERYAIRQGLNEITSAVFSSDGRTLLLGQKNGDVVLWDAFLGKAGRRLHGHSEGVRAVACSAGGRTFLSGSADTTALLWDKAALRERPAAKVENLTPAEIDTRWEELASADSPRAWAALRALAGDAAHSVPLLRRHLRPAHVKDDQLRRWIAALDDDAFTAREQASQGLEQAGDAARRLLHAALEEKPSLEKRLRLLRLLEGMDHPSAIVRREGRAVEVLLCSGTPEARTLLRTLAQGAPEHRLTRQAKAALRCLDSLPCEQAE